jgi:hypothetical protein
MSIGALRIPSQPRGKIAFNASTVRSSSSPGKSATTIDIPALANLLHIARPIPRAAPVTTATLSGLTIVAANMLQLRDDWLRLERSRDTGF